MKFLNAFLYLAAVLCASPALADSHKRAVVFDVDGTLTPNVYTINIARRGAAEAAQAYADTGITVIYLTARIPLFQNGLDTWLVDNGFPGGRLHLMQTDADKDDHEAFKTRVLTSYRDDGWTFVAAFGDSSSDFGAYAQAGIAQDDVFALRRVGAWDCKDGIWRGCYKNWTDITPQIIAGLEAQPE